MNLARLDDVLDGVPAPPGVVAHMAPNAPEREGFRRAKSGGFFVPLTSMQRLNGGRDGWRLHVIAAGTCRVSVVVGDIPRQITVSVSPTPDHQWQVKVDGTKPPIVLRADAAEKIGVSLISDEHAAVQVRLGTHAAASTVIDASTAPTPPYTLAFDGGRGNDCALVWQEIPFPFEPKP